MSGNFYKESIIVNVVNIQSLFGSTSKIKIKHQIAWNIKSNKPKGGNDKKEDAEIEWEDADLGDVDFDDADLKELMDDEPKKPKTQIDKKLSDYVFERDIKIFLEDSIGDFKRKIFVSSRIPIYRQHLWYEKGGKV